MALNIQKATKLLELSVSKEDSEDSIEDYLE